MTLRIPARRGAAKRAIVAKSRGGPLNFQSLVAAIGEIDCALATQAGRAVNVSLTMRNWMIGCFIAEYELNGADRARYGERLLAVLAVRLARLHVSNSSRRQLYDYLRFYRTYPRIVRTLSAQFRSLLPPKTLARKVPTPSAQSSYAGAALLGSLSYSMFRLLVELDDDERRAFYEHECISGGWSVRELRRQIASLYFERSGLSTNRKKLAAMMRQKAERAAPRLDIRDPYVFEFLGLKPREVMGESHLEDRLLDRLHGFLMELGQGFCFEARQKRILIGESHGFVDLVFYHRILKCHVLIELKLKEFGHEAVSQLNTYVTWYRRNMMTRGDNPPVGILLCAKKDESLVEYACAGLDNKLFVSKYQLHLPKRDQLRREMERAMRIRES